jgi:3-deoxy-D-manno-octulosonic-acid transferase
MLLVYRIIIYFIIILSPIIILIRLIKNKEHPIRFKEKFCLTSKKRGNGNLVWFHGSSVGEILSVIPLIRELEKNNSVQKILITSSTLSSSSIFEKIKLKKTIHQFFPIDSEYLTNKFLKFWKPSLAIFIESEIWPNMYCNIKNKNIPLILINARITKKTFKKWIIFKKFSKTIFNKIDIAYPQNFETKNYLKELKLSKIKQIGNLKFTESKNDTTKNLNKLFIKQIKNRKIWCASSTHAGEELICAKVHLKLKKKYKNLLTIIIPRHIHRVNEIKDKIEKLELKIITRSSKNKITKNTDIYIVDTYGETKKFYQISKTVFLGGSLINRGGQNPIEAASLGSNIIHGPNVDNFKEVYKLFHDKKISYIAKNFDKLTHLVNKLIKINKNNNNKYIKIKKIGRHILQNTIKEINILLKNEIKKT